MQRLKWQQRNTEHLEIWVHFKRDARFDGYRCGGIGTRKDELKRGNVRGFVGVFGRQIDQLSSDACDMCAYAFYATAGVNNVVWCGGSDLAACIKTFQDYMTRMPQVSCIVIDGAFTTLKEDAATILAGIKKIDGH